MSAVPKEATIAQFAPGPEAEGYPPSEPYVGPSPAGNYAESLNQALWQGFADGQG